MSARMDRLIVAGLATWRLSSLLLYESGPLDIFMRLRSAVENEGLGPAPLRQLFSCMWCMSPWVGLVCAVLMLTEYWVALLPFALSAVAILVDQCSKRLSR